MSTKSLFDCIKDVYPDDVIQTISEMSKNEEKPLVNSSIKGINFDKLTEYYFRNKNLKDVTPSNDSVIKFKGMDYFVEFKDSKGRNFKKKDIYRKIISSLLVYLDITDQKVASIKDSLGYILVYNPYKDSSNDNSRERIHKKLGKLAEKKQFDDKYKIKVNYEGLYFKDTLFFTPKGFNDEINENSVSL